MRRALLALISLAACCRIAVAQSESQRAEDRIRALLEAQAAAWNRGDVEGFMQRYWKSPAITFVTSKGILRGWQEVLDRYKRDYPDRRAMGTLAFSDLAITMLSPKAALVIGHWQLERAKDRPGGVFTLILREFPQGWRIVHDHTTVVSHPEAVVTGNRQARQKKIDHALSPGRRRRILPGSIQLSTISDQPSASGTERAFN